MGRKPDRMRLYESQIQQYIDDFHGYHADPTPEEYARAKHRLWTYHQDRFINTLKGYHEVFANFYGDETKNTDSLGGNAGQLRSDWQASGAIHAAAQQIHRAHEAVHPTS